MLPANEFGPASIGTSFTAFLSKLWKIVNDPITDDLIKWSQKGTSFIITDQIRFTQELVPKYFKHNNMASFVRQLNMYGFRKMVSIEAGGLTVDGGEIAFSHPQFIRGQPALIRQIKRKLQSTRALTTSVEGSHNATNLLLEVQKLRLSQENMGSKLMGIKKENELLWREYANMRQKFSKQQQIIEKLVQFLVAMVKSPSHSLNPKRKFTHLALEGVEGSSPSTNSIFGNQDSTFQFDSANRMSLSGPVIHEVTHLNGDTEPQFLDKVFQSESSTPVISRISTPSPIMTAASGSGTSSPVIGKKSRESLLKLEPVEYVSPTHVDQNLKEYSPDGQVQSIVNPNESSRASLFSDSMYPDEVIVTYVDPLEFEAEDPHRLVKDTHGWSHKQSTVSLTSPYGTTLKKEILYDPELNPELLQMVDPSAVNPNIFLNVPTQSGVNWTTTTATTTTTTTSSLSSTSSSGSDAAAARRRGVNLTKLPRGEGKTKLMCGNPNSHSVVNIGSGKRVSSGTGSVAKSAEVKVRKGKLNSVGKANFASTDLPNAFTSDAKELQNLGFTTSDVAIPDKSSFLEKDLSSHLDEVQTSLDSLQDIFNSGTFNVDISTILSLFANDEGVYMPEQEQWTNNNSEVSGTEVSLYSPSLYDITEEDSDQSCSFSSLLQDEASNSSLASPAKRPRLVIKKQRMADINPSLDDALATPRPHI